MPFFSSKFNQYKTTPRKSLAVSSLRQGLGKKASQQEFGESIGEINLKLGNVEGKFQDGQWIIESQNNEEMTKLTKQNHTLRKENNLLKLKVEILLDMLAETTIETHLKEKEFEELQSKYR